MSERDQAQASAEVLGLPLLDGKQLPDSPPQGLAEGLPLSLRFLKQFHVCPLALDEQGVRLWLADAHDPYPQQAVQLALGVRVTPVLGMRAEIDDLVER
ncbi:hypothetical protein, partial [Enterobacter hormaechei]|uniref:GspE/PulE/PilB domain-containing protein n=1 Tax=Enterobacter hormaechei TaxID=158836 RepID=UPI0020400771